MKKLLFCIASLLMMATMAYSQEEATLTVTVSKDSILSGHPVEVRFTVSNTSVKHFEPPVFEGLRVLSGPNQSTSMVISNGKMKQTITYSYWLEGAEPGSFYIPPAWAETEAGTLESIPLEVYVLPNSDNIPPDNRQRSTSGSFGFGDNFFDNRSFFFDFDQDDFFGGSDMFRNFFEEEIFPFTQPEQLRKEQSPKFKKQKKRKVYRL